MNNKWEITQNTDTVDIDAKSIGLDVYNGSLHNDVYRDRGLYIQIRHNRDKETYEAVNKLAHLIAAAPEMLEALDLCLRHINEMLQDEPKFRTNREIGLCIKLRNLITKAKGETNE